jgi:hypothetical protein
MLNYQRVVRHPMVFFRGFGARPAAVVAVRAATVRGDGREHYGAASGRSLGALV